MVKHLLTNKKPTIKNAAYFCLNKIFQDSNLYHFGETKIFLKSGVINNLEKKLTKMVELEVLMKNSAKITLAKMNTEKWEIHFS